MRLRQAHATVASLMPPICQIHGVSLIQGQPALSQQPSSSLVSMLAKVGIDSAGTGNSCINLQLLQAQAGCPGTDAHAAL
jgi:5-enolpyruvylshikimate-3-phosphate synthase